MSHRDTSIAIRQAITSALNVTQGHKRSYPTSYYPIFITMIRIREIRNRDKIGIRDRIRIRYRIKIRVRIKIKGQD